MSNALPRLFSGLPTLALAAGLTLAGARAEVSLAPIFTPHAVLQAGMPVPVWGTADPSQTVTVTYAGQTRTAQADARGRWSVTLDPLDAGLTGELTVAGGNTLRLADVVTGEVWMAGGQSNMTMPVRMTRNAKEEIAAADYPLIREFRPGIQVSETPQDTVGGTWQVCNPKTVPGFSAIGYFFARALFKDLDVPVGIINCNKGGSLVEAWMSPEAFAQSSQHRAAQAYIDAAAKRYLARQAEVEPGERKTLPDYGPGGYNNPSVLYNGMLHPLLPYAIRGVIWNQGEANVPYARHYAALFAETIADWRAQWGRPDLPFLFCQLPNISEKMSYDRTGRGYPLLREAQLEALQVPGTGMTVAIDIGDLDDRHYRNKQEAGRRLAVLAEETVYDKPVAGQCPVPTGHEVDGATMRVTFAHAGEGLTLSSGEAPGAWEIAGDDQVFHPATAVIDGEAVVVSSSEVVAPVAVRYAWKTAPEGANLVNAAGLPATPFRTDRWDK